MTLKSQKHLYSLDPGTHYLNCAYMSPLMKKVEQAGIEGVMRKRNPSQIKPIDFFNGAPELKQMFGKLVNTESKKIAIISSVSYGIGAAANSVKLRPGSTILTIHEEFPSNVYPWYRLAEKNGLKIKTIKPGDIKEGRGKSWNNEILQNLTKDVSLVALPHVHWADGTKFSLEQISRELKNNESVLVIDGTQSIGALPFDVDKIKPDALVAAGYKWLMGPYSMGLAYYGDYFKDGIPLEETWMNRKGSEDFAGLVNYQSEYREGAARYDVGEHSNFILLPMLTEALRQIQEWKPENIQDYCRNLTAPLIRFLRENNFWVEESENRAEHLFGVKLPGT
jgi:selenocysteine lyase/cysteine desulfurase